MVPPLMHLYRLNFKLEFAKDHWLRVIAASCFVVMDLVSIDFKPKIVAMASAYAAFANAAVHSALVALLVRCLHASTNHFVKTLVGLEAAPKTFTCLDSSLVIASCHDYLGPIIRSWVTTSPGPY